MSTLSDIWATLSSYRQLLGLLAMFFGPALLGKVVRFAQRRNSPPTRPPAPPTSKTLIAIVLLHALYAAYSLLLPPYDVFSSHGLRIRTPSDRLRPIVLRDAGLTLADVDASALDAHPLIGLLLMRLTSLDARYAYVRWGHATFLRCTWCRGNADYALAAVPHLLTPYVAQALLVGAMGWQAIAGVGATERKVRFRSIAGWALGTMLAVDVGLRWLLDIRAGPDGDCVHLDTSLHQIRTVTLFLVTAAYAFWPVPDDARAAETTLLATLTAALHTLRLSSLARTAVARSPALNRITTEMRERRARAEDAARADSTVIGAAQGVGVMDGGEYSARARGNAQEWIDAQWARTVRPSTA